MKGRWWRAYDVAVDDPKLQRLSPALFRAWFNLMCLASANAGVLPSTDDIAFKLHVSRARADAILAALMAARLIDRRADGRLAPHNWDERQFTSDVSTERVKRFRKRARDAAAAVAETAPESESDPESESESESKSKSESESQSESKSESASETETQSGRTGGACYSAVFEDKFWKPYPRTPVMSKAEAWKAWREAGEAERQKIIAAVPRYAAWLRDRPGHLAVHACRFISQRRHEGFAETAEAAPVSLVLIAPQTPEWQAWWDYHDGHRNAVGASFGLTRMRRARADGQPHHERTRWPPGFAPPPGDAG
ncbi:MAG TPA: hypothetical protein VKX28_29380 [Xanthobacteraceae bacterium]|nr:hypothetical protein [Xanthobacteraceae bacterium]